MLVQRQVQCVLWCPGLCHHPSSLSQICLPSWGRRGSRAQRALQHIHHQIKLPCTNEPVLHWAGSLDLPWWKWQHFNICWGARPLDPLVADSLEVNFPAAHQLFLFCFQWNNPPELSQISGEVAKAEPWNSVLLHNEQCHSHHGGDRRGWGLGLVSARLAVDFGFSQKEEGPSIT